MFRRSSNRCFFVIAVIVSAVVAAADIQGQAAGSLAGTVCDPTGAVLPGVRITISSLKGETEKKALSNESGRFDLRDLSPGRYVAEASIPGFAPWLAKVTIQPGQQLERDLVLGMDAIAATVEVTASAPMGAKPPIQSSSPLRIGGDFLSPVLLKEVKPVYPAAARDAGISGIVVLRGIIMATGEVSDLAVLRSPSRELSRSALEAVSQWTYRPPKLNGVPVALPTAVTVTFRLQE